MKTLAALLLLVQESSVVHESKDAQGGEKRVYVFVPVVAALALQAVQWPVMLAPPTFPGAAESARSAVLAEVRQQLEARQWQLRDLEPSDELRDKLSACAGDSGCIYAAGAQPNGETLLVTLVTPRSNGHQVELTLIDGSSGRVLGRARGESLLGATSAANQAATGLSLQVVPPIRQMQSPQEVAKSKAASEKKVRSWAFWTGVIGGAVILAAGIGTVTYGEVNLRKTNAEIFSNPPGTNPKLVDDAKFFTDVRTAGIVGISLGAVGVTLPFIMERIYAKKPSPTPAPET